MIWASGTGAIHLCRQVVLTDLPLDVERQAPVLEKPSAARHRLWPRSAPISTLVSASPLAPFYARSGSPPFGCWRNGELHLRIPVRPGDRSPLRTTTRCGAEGRAHHRADLGWNVVAPLGFALAIVGAKLGPSVVTHRSTPDGYPQTRKIQWGKPDEIIANSVRVLQFGIAAHLDS